MYNESNVPLPEYRVRPVVRYVITRYCHGYVDRASGLGLSGSSEVVAEVSNENRAEEIARQLADGEAAQIARMKPGRSDTPPAT